MSNVKVRNHVVVSSWKADKPAVNHKGTLHTDGKRLWSYELQIGDTIDGVKVLRDHTARGRWDYHSQTTSCHVGEARKVADLVD